MTVNTLQHIEFEVCDNNKMPIDESRDLKDFEVPADQLCEWEGRGLHLFGTGFGCSHMMDNSCETSTILDLK
jgi:hypothetical protein